MMQAGRFKIWISAFRLHTLPLSLSGILLGNMVAFSYHSFNYTILFLSLITGINLQVLSNLANDYGDFVHGADSEKRIGPERTVQSGAISPASMKNAILFFIILSVLTGILLLIFSIPNCGIISALIFLLIGLSAIWAAYHYTASKNPYGYKGWGDIYVFIFFGLAAVYGTFYLQSGILSPWATFPAIAIGFFSSGVLNLNNIRDINNDKESGKITLAVKLGEKKARIYHFLLMLGGCMAMITFCLHIYSKTYQFFFLAPLLLFIINAVTVMKTYDPLKFYAFLKQLSISVLIYVLFFSLSLIIWQ